MSWRVVITGFMGAGKTTVARELAQLLSCVFVDLDELVAEREGRTPQELIDREGEARFREMETGALRAALAAGDSFVIALGGGAWTVEENRALIAACGCHAVWLDAPFELCWRRIKQDAALRPFARDPEHARRLYDERRPLYRLAQTRLHVEDGQSPARLAHEIAATLRGGQPKD